MVSSTVRPADEWRHGWRTLAAGFCGVGVSWVPFQIVASLFILPMQAEFGWSRAAVSIGPIGGLVTILFYLPVGLLMDRIGPRRVAIVSLTLFALTMLGFAAVPANRVLFLALVIWAAIIGAGASSLVFSRGLATCFRQRIGTALGLMMNGASVTSAIGMPLIASIIAFHGWRMGFVTLAVAILWIGLPVVVLWFHPRAFGSSKGDESVAMVVPDGHSLREATSDVRFWMLFGAFFMAALPIGGFLAHLQPLLVGRGTPTSIAALLGSAFAISIGAGRIVVGMLLDRLNPSWIAGGTLMLSATGTLVLHREAPEGASMLGIVAAVALIGLAQGAESDYLSFFSLRLFGLRSFAPILSILAMAVSGGMALGGLAFSLLFDWFGDYDLAMRAAAVGYALAGILLIFVRVPPARATT